MATQQTNQYEIWRASVDSGYSTACQIWPWQIWHGVGTGALRIFQKWLHLRPYSSVCRIPIGMKFGVEDHTFTCQIWLWSMKEWVIETPQSWKFGQTLRYCGSVSTRMGDSRPT